MSVIIKLPPSNPLLNHTVKNKNAESYFYISWMGCSGHDGLLFGFHFGGVHELSLATHKLYAPCSLTCQRLQELWGMRIACGGWRGGGDTQRPHSERRKGILNQEKKVDTMNMDSGSVEYEILSFLTIKLREEKAKESTSNLPISQLF